MSGEGGGIVGDSEKHGTAIGQQIVDTVRNGHTDRVGAEVGLVDQYRRAIPLGARGIFTPVSDLPRKLHIRSRVYGVVPEAERVTFDEVELTRFLVGDLDSRVVVFGGLDRR
jgi:hypothetical protein